MNMEEAPLWRLFLFLGCLSKKNVMNSIPENFDKIIGKIRKAESASGRERGACALVAVTKTQSAENLQAALAHGHRMFGENKVQEAQSHWAELKKEYPDLKLHLIGPLQTNKASDAVALFDCIETLDREKLALALEAEMKKQGRAIPCFVQVNTGEEEQKGGIAPSELGAFLDFCRHETSLQITGLMCIPPMDEPSALHFAFLKKLAMENDLPHLSMGMSSDYERAVMLGATHVRIGTLLFGARG